VLCRDVQGGIVSTSTKIIVGSRSRVGTAALGLVDNNTVTDTHTSD
jgi:hypothetical protein